MRSLIRGRLLSLAVALPLQVGAPAAAELEVHTGNPRWLTDDGGGTALALTGAHTWSLFQDYDFDPHFDAAGYLARLGRDGHNFTRGWFWEDDYYAPLPYVKKDGLYRLSPPYRSSYLKRLRKRIRYARRRGLNVSVMLFQGWSMQDHDGLRQPGPWPVNPYNRQNTAELVTKQQAALHVGLAQTQQLAYVTHLAKKLCSEPNVIFEIANEADPRSLGTPSASNWQRNVLQRLRNTCGRRLAWVSCPSKIGLSGEAKRNLNDAMFAMGADLVAPCDPRGRQVSDPPFADGRRVVVADSDHFGRVTFEWAWKAFLRGQHPVFMDLTQTLTWWSGSPWDPDDPEWNRVRRALGAIQELVATVNRKRAGHPASGLAEMAPQPGPGGGPNNLLHPASSRWALFSSDAPCPRAQNRGPCSPARANGEEFLVYAGPSETVQICALHARQEYRSRWKKARGGGFVARSETRTADARGCLTVTNPSRLVSILHLERKPSPT